jgi:hypothetical protein
MDPKIADFIRENRGRYTREAIRQRLIEAGHPPEEVDWTWDRLAAAEPEPPASPSGYRTYVWIVFALCAALIAFSILGLSYFGVGWLIAFVAIAYWPARWFARQRPKDTASWVGLAIAAPLAFVLIGGGICLATVVVVVSTLQF